MTRIRTLLLGQCLERMQKLVGFVLLFLPGRNTVCLDVGNIIERGQMTPCAPAMLLTDGQMLIMLNVPRASLALLPCTYRLIRGLLPRPLSLTHAPKDVWRPILFHPLTTTGPGSFGAHRKVEKTCRIQLVRELTEPQ